MGYGEIIGNESVHLKFVRESQYEGKIITGTEHATDPIPFAEIGAKEGGTNGHFTVTLQFSSDVEAEKYFMAATMKDGAIVLQVPAVHRERDKVDPPTPAAEVRVDW